MSVTEKKNNGGFSLVELIVVIAISVVLIGAATISIRSVMGVEVKQCARNIESIINKTRVTTMGKDSAVLEIYKDASDGAYYYKTTINGTVSAPSKIGVTEAQVHKSLMPMVSAAAVSGFKKTAPRRLSRYTRRPARWYVSNLYSLMMNILF